MAQHASYIAGPQYFPADVMARDASYMNPGVATEDDLVVAATTPSATMAVTVSGASQGSVGGNAWLPQGYNFNNDAQVTLTIATANATYGRYDLVVAGVDTTQNPYDPTIMVITGTPASSPSVPAMPGTFIGIVLAHVYVGANVTGISPGNILDRRTIAGIASSALYNASVQDVKLTTTLPIGVVTYTPGVDRNFLVAIYLRVVNATTNVTVSIGYVSKGGSQTNTLLNVQSCTVGEYSLIPVTINATAWSPITVTVTSGTANNLYVSASIQGV